MDPFKLIVDEHEMLATWAAERIPHFAGWSTHPRAIGYAMNGVVRGAVIYHNYTRGNVFASIALDGPLTRRYLFAIFYNPFVHWGVRHISSAVEKSNEPSLRLCLHLGFQIEGRMREAGVEGDDVIICGMLKRECKWLNLRKG